MLTEAGEMFLPVPIILEVYYTVNIFNFTGLWTYKSVQILSYVHNPVTLKILTVNPYN